MPLKSEGLTLSQSIDLVKEIRIAVCGELTSACKRLRDIGVSHIDRYNDAVEVSFALRSGKEYHLILVYAPQGEGLNAEIPYKVKLKGEWKKVPLKLLSEPSCDSALIELTSTVFNIARHQNENHCDENPLMNQIYATGLN